jgi:hypothetical protein
VAGKISSGDWTIKDQLTGSTRVQSRGIMSHDDIAKSTAQEIPQCQRYTRKSIKIVQKRGGRGKRRGVGVVWLWRRVDGTQTSERACHALLRHSSARPSKKPLPPPHLTNVRVKPRAIRLIEDNKVGGRIPLATVRAALAAIARVVRSSSDLPRRTTTHDPTAVLQS